MPSITFYNPTSTDIDGVLMGIKWASTSLTFSFPGSASNYGSPYPNDEPSNNFKAYNTTTQKAAVRAVLQMYADATGLTFTEITETDSTHADIRYAMSDAPSTAWGYYPTISSEGGDIWFNNSTHHYDNPVIGNYAWLTIIHETGHALGLKHPHAVVGNFGAMSTATDALENTVMSYRSYIGGGTSGYTNASDSYPQTPMLFDLAALQHNYGANYTTRNGDTTYKWSPTTGALQIDGVSQGTPTGNKVFSTIWDGGGNDTYDFTDYSTPPSVDLSPEAWITTVSTQLANLGSGHVPTGTIRNARLYNGNTASQIENSLPSDEDVTDPTINGLNITSDPGVDGYYDADDNIDIAVAFSESVDKTGTPQLTINVGGSNKTANYSSGTGTSVLTFRYTVQEGDSDSDGISVAANSLALNGGTIKDAAGNDAVLTHSALSTQSGHKVGTPADVTAPIVSSFSPSDGATGVPGSTQLIVTFSEPIQAGTVMLAEIRKSSDDSLISHYTEANLENDMYIRDNKLIIAPTSALIYGTAAYVQISSGSVKDMAGNIFTGIDDTTTWNFTLEDTPVHTVSPFSKFHA